MTNEAMSEGEVIFYLRPGGDEPFLKEHDAEAERQGADFLNYGWVSGDRCICSKTTKGILSTAEKNGKFTHHWEPYR